MKDVIGKGKLVKIHYQNISFSTIGIFLIKKPLPIALMNILSMLNRNWRLKYLNHKDHLRCIV